MFGRASRREELQIKYCEIYLDIIKICANLYREVRMPGPIEVASPEFIQQDIINIKTLLYALRGVLVVSFHLTQLWSVFITIVYKIKGLHLMRFDSVVSISGRH